MFGAELRRSSHIRGRLSASIDGESLISVKLFIIIAPPVDCSYASTPASISIPSHLHPDRLSADAELFTTHRARPWVSTTTTMRP
jgi:hypothetical protein